jgi:hypothetical protein
MAKTPDYLERLPDGRFKVDLTKKWQPTDKQREIETLIASQRVLRGGIRSGKTAGAIMHDVQYGLLRYPKCNMLVVRKTFAELKAGPIEDFREHCPPELYSYHQTDHVATFFNGSRLVFGHCKHGKEEDVQIYLGTAYPYIILDECAQLSPEAWNLLMSRNTVNPECMPDTTQPCGGCGDPQTCGYPCLPVPHITGCTNPFGDYWLWYKSMFVDHEPYEVPEGARKDRNGRYWILTEYAEPQLVYNPDDYATIKSTVLDNPHALRKDPGIIDRLNKLPPHMRDLMLLGYDEGGTGQYFQGSFTEESNVIDLKADPEAVIWEPWQPVFGGWDWGLSSSWNALYFFTQAQVKTKVVDKKTGTFSYEYRRKIVCFKEYVVKDKLAREVANIVASTLKYPDGTPVEKVAWIAFSHEKFARSVEEHSPADIVSQELTNVGLCPVTRGTTNRIGRATLMFQKLAHRELVILRHQCPEIIKAIPNLMSDPDLPLDVKKPKSASKIDDCYDGFSLGLYAFVNPTGKPGDMREQEYLDDLDPVARHFRKWGNTIKRQKVGTAPKHRPLWQDRLKGE